MKTLYSCLFLSVLVLWMALPPACLEKRPVRPGKCPPIIEIGCVEPQKDMCRMDADCPQPKKCCYEPCSLRCVNPRKR